MSRIEQEIQNAMPINVHDPVIQQAMMDRLFADEGNPTKDEIIPNLHLGRAGDTINDNYDVVIAATNMTINGHDSFDNCPKVIQLPCKKDGDVGIESFRKDNQSHLVDAISSIDDALKKGERVFVCCQQGKDRSALVVLCYLVAKYNVTPQQAYDYTQNKRPIVSTADIPKYWDFLEYEFDVDTAKNLLNSENNIHEEQQIIIPLHDEELLNTHWDDVPLDIKQVISDTCQEIRHQMGLSSQEYWNTLSIEEQEQWMTFEPEEVNNNQSLAEELYTTAIIDYLKNLRTRYNPNDARKGFFDESPKSKYDALTRLIGGLNGENVNLLDDVDSIYRKNNTLGKEIRRIVKSGDASRALGVQINRVRDFIQTVQNNVNQHNII